MSLDDAQTLYESGSSLEASAQAVGVSRECLRQNLIARGVKIRPRRKRVLTPGQERELLRGHMEHKRIEFEISQLQYRLEELRAEKRSYRLKTLAANLDISPKTAWSIIQRMGAK